MNKLELLQKYQGKNYDIKTNKIERDKIQLIRKLIYLNVLNEKTLLDLACWIGKKFAYYTKLGETR